MNSSSAWDHLDDQFLGREVGAGQFNAVDGDCFVHIAHDAAGTGGSGRF